MATKKPTPKTKMKLVKHMLAITANSSLELKVKRTGGLNTTHALVVSTGTDTEAFSDSQMTPGPATKALNGANSYVIVWTVAFVEDGTATLNVVVLDDQGQKHDRAPVPVTGKAGDIAKRVVVIG